jgi:O-antigen ligase
MSGSPAVPLPPLPGGAAMPAMPRVARWLPALFLALLVLPFDPFWLDAEQCRRGLLLVLAGAALIAVPALRPVAGERWLLALVCAFVVSAVIAWTGDAWFRDANAPATFQLHDAASRIAHWLALAVVLRLGAASGGAAAAGPVFVVLLAVTSAFGLLQSLGLAAIEGYGVEREPVSVFGNLNVAAEWTTIAALVVAVALPELSARWRAAALTALALAGAYTVVDGSRSGLLALPLGLVLLAVLRRRAGGALLPVAAAAAGAALGALQLQLGATQLPPASPAAAMLRPDAERGSKTVEVRLEIAKGTGRLFAQSPVFGLGPGQFPVHYPRVRSEREIELSSHGRQFASEVRTAHDDWLELLVDGGAIALLLFAAAVFALQRAQRDKARLVPLFALLVLMLVRAPLWNAPAAAAALWLVGAPDARAAVRRWHRAAAIAIGLALVALGVPVLLGNHFAARYQQQVRAREQPDAALLTTAAGWLPFEPRLFQLLSQEQLLARDHDGAQRAAAKALRLRPFDPQLHVHLGEALAQARQYRAALEVAVHGLAIDPPNPALRVLRSVALAQLGDADAAVLAVAVDPHPVLRSSLAQHFRDLVQVAVQLPDRSAAERAAARFHVEHHFVAAVDGLGDTSAAGIAARNEHVREMTVAMRADESGRRPIVPDARPLLFGALAALDRGEITEANKWGASASQFRALAPWERALLGDHLERLRTLDGWQAFLAKR